MIAMLSWLEGTWTAAPFEMTFTSAASAPVLGALRGGGYFEFFRFQEDDGGLTLVAYPRGVPAGIHRLADDAGPGRLTFVDETNVHATRIWWHRLEDGAMLCGYDGQDGRKEWRFERKGPDR